MRASSALPGQRWLVGGFVAPGLWMPPGLALWPLAAALAAFQVAHLRLLVRALAELAREIHAPLWRDNRMGFL
jgi:hypothetical protein